MKDIDLSASSAILCALIIIKDICHDGRGSNAHALCNPFLWSQNNPLSRIPLARQLQPLVADGQRINEQNSFSGNE